MHAFKLPSAGLVLFALSASVVVSSVEAQRGLPPEPAQTDVSSVADLLGGLEARLAVNPEDRDGWVLLAKSYHYLARYEEAKLAFMRARELGYEGQVLTSPNDPGGNKVLPKRGGMIHDFIGDAYGDAESDD